MPERPLSPLHRGSSFCSVAVVFVRLLHTTCRFSQLLLMIYRFLPFLPAARLIYRSTDSSSDPFVAGHQGWDPKGTNQTIDGVYQL